MKNFKGEAIFFTLSDKNKIELKSCSLQNFQFLVKEKIFLLINIYYKQRDRFLILFYNSFRYPYKFVFQEIGLDET